ncbi:hypothetical protein ACWD6N_33530 [Micromonospora sp. NPDC005163]
MADDAPTPVHLSKVLDGLAENPALPAGLVRRLVRYRRGSGHVATRPDLTLDLIEEIDEVRAAACSTYHARSPHPVPPPDLVTGLLADPVTRAGAVRHALLTLELAARLAGDPDYQVRRQLAEHPQLPPPMRDLLTDDPSANVRVGVFGRRDTPEPVRHRIYDDIQQGERPLTDLLTDELDDDALLQQVEDHMAVAELRYLRLAWVTADPLPYLSSPYICFRRSAARSRALPADAVIRLLNDDDSGVRTTMATHAPHLVDPATAERIDREYQPDKKTTWRPADVFTFPPQTLRRLATDADPRMRCLAPRDLDLPVELAERLATDPESVVRRAVAGHPNLPVHVRRALLADPNESVAHATAAAPTLPVAEMDRLLTLAGV